MVKEEYVSFKVAKLLKEKGFSEKTVPFYQGDGTFCSRKGNVYCSNDWNHDKFVYFSAPTQQMAMRWLREVHGILINAEPWYREVENPHKKGEYGSVLSGWGYLIHDIITNTLMAESDEDNLLCSYEQVCDAGIKYCLEILIK